MIETPGVSDRSEEDHVLRRAPDRPGGRDAGWTHRGRRRFTRTW